MSAVLTEKQGRVLYWIKERIVIDGRPPTRAELATYFGWRSPNAAEEKLRALERLGRIRLLPGISRGIQVLGPTHCPNCGHTLSSE